MRRLFFNRKSHAELACPDADQGFSISKILNRVQDDRQPSPVKYMLNYIYIPPHFLFKLIFNIFD